MTAHSLATALGRALHADVASRARSIAALVQTDGARLAAKRLTADYCLQ